MTSMVERVARALYELLRKDFRDQAVWERTTEMDREVFRPFARAAIVAMREPTDEMVDAGFHKADTNDRSERAYRWVADDVWHAMIDAALEETDASEVR